jgi:hypothetical protein
MCFYAPPGEGGGGGGGGGGGTGTVDPPAPPAGGDPALAAADADVLAFTPPGLDQIDLGEPGGKPPGGDGKGGTPPDPAKVEADRKAAEAKSAADKKAEADKAAAAAKAKGDGELPLDKLRTAYEDTKRELATLRETAAKGDPRVKELEAERDAQKAELAAARKEIEDRKAREMETDPEVLKPLREMDAKYDEDAEAFYSTMEKLDHPAVKSLLPKFGALKKGTAGYDERFAAFSKELNVALGAEEDSRHPSFDRALQWVQQSYKFATQRNQLTAEIQKTAATRYHENATKTYTARKGELGKLIEAAKTVPEGMEKTLPTHPKVILKNLLSTLKPEQVEAITKGVPEFIELAQLGVPPRTEKDYVGMKPDEIQAARGREAAAVEAARAHLPDVVYNGMIALRVLGAVMRDNAKLRERLGEKRESDPPDPGGDGKDGKQKGEGDNLIEWKPPSLDHMDY